MKVFSLKQGSTEWHKFRAEHYTASDAPAMLGFSKYKTRTQLLDEKKTGITPEVDAATQARFDDGHATEEKARIILEEITGMEFFPVTGESDEHPNLAASLDGQTDVILEDEHSIFEHKLWNQKLVEYIELNQDLPDTHWPQVEQQLLVSGAEFCRFVVSDGTASKRLEFRYFPNAERQQQVINGWAQFKKDLEAHVPAEPEVKVVAATLLSLIHI